MDGGTSLSQVRGLGSARAGTDHWTLQRMTAIANLTLLTWLAVTLATVEFGSQAAVVRWLATPYAAVPLLLLCISIFTHLRLGLTTLIEDYVHSETVKLPLLLLLNFCTWGGVVFALFSVLKLALTVASGAPNA